MATGSLVITFTRIRNSRPGGLRREQKVDEFRWGHIESDLLLVRPLVGRCTDCGTWGKVRAGEPDWRVPAHQALSGVSPGQNPQELEYLNTIFDGVCRRRKE